ncbi:MAG TPA: aminodeoxychorismate synthase component I [Prolixibacteraceae bacterium]|nr:aminodeoxychorismate synthase component I [Prolixibacteraceae bacterium]
MNRLGKLGEPFVFLIDFEMEKPRLFPLNENDLKLWLEIPGFSKLPENREKIKLKYWETSPVSFEQYKNGFKRVKKHILNGDTYLLNYTQPTPVKTNLTPAEIFASSLAPFKIYLENEFVCFSPERFVQIQDGKIFSHPMKGTIDADQENAIDKILSDKKELAEHNTIVDLIRNDLSLVAEDVKVDEFRYISHIKTNNKNLLQVSSAISGVLTANYAEQIGDIIYALLPAGSVSGAPKKKTLEIIKAAENYKRGYYTGVFGVFDGKNLDSCVLIRYIEIDGDNLIYKSGGGITFMSEAKKEYEEMLKKVYVPIA